MNYFDFDLSDKPAPMVGRVLVKNPTSDLWDRVRENRPPPAALLHAVTWLIQITDVLPFIAELPDDMKPPTQIRPESGLPRNVWVGGHFYDVWPEILDVRSRVRFLIIDDAVDIEALEDALAAWRCSNCGRRGLAPRPPRCPHAAGLCGDAKLLPQIGWIIDTGPSGDSTARFDIAHDAGAAYWPTEFPRVG